MSATDWLTSDVLGLSFSVPIDTTCSALTGSGDVLIGPTVVIVAPELVVSGCTTPALGHTAAAATVDVGTRGVTDTAVWRTAAAVWRADYPTTVTVVCCCAVATLSFLPGTATVVYGLTVSDCHVSVGITSSSRV